jgi:hypothetical protein
VLGAGDVGGGVQVWERRCFLARIKDERQIIEKIAFFCLVGEFRRSIEYNADLPSTTNRICVGRIPPEAATSTTRISRRLTFARMSSQAFCKRNYYLYRDKLGGCQQPNVRLPEIDGLIEPFTIRTLTNAETLTRMRALLLALQDFAVKWPRQIPERYARLEAGENGVITSIRIEEAK